MRYRAPRRPSDKRIGVDSSAGSHTVTVRNFSHAGVSLIGHPPLPIGEAVMVSILLGVVNARVVWCRGEMVGLKFDRILSHREMSVFMPNGHQSQYGQWRAQGKNGRELPKEMQ